MTEWGPAEAQRRQDWRRAQRQLARTHHPDVAGGDTQRFVQLMHELDRRFDIRTRSGAVNRPWPTPAGSASVTIRRGPRARLRRGLQASGRAVRVVRAHLPRRVPGARRYIEL